MLPELARPFLATTGRDRSIQYQLQISKGEKYLIENCIVSPNFLRCQSLATGMNQSSKPTKISQVNEAFAIFSPVRLRILALLILARRKSYQRETGLDSVNAGFQGFYTSLRNSHSMNNAFTSRFLLLKGKAIWCK